MDPKRRLQKKIPLALFGTLWTLGALGRPWPPQGVFWAYFWPPIGSSWRRLGISMGSLGLTLAPVGFAQPPLGLPLASPVTHLPFSLRPWVFQGVRCDAKTI